MPPRFADASVFVHAFLKPRRALRPHEDTLKRHARAIITRITRGESVVTSVVHVGEIANVLEDWMQPTDTQAILLGLLTQENVDLLPVARPDFLAAVAVASEHAIGTTDALAAVLMRRHGIREIYSFDRDFDVLENLNRVGQ